MMPSSYLSLGIVAIVALSTTSLNNASETAATASVFKPPHVTANGLWVPSIDDVDSIKTSSVMSCCANEDGTEILELSCSEDGSENDNPPFKLVEIGKMPQFTTDQALDVLQKAREAWKGGAGTWTQMTLKERCDKIEAFFVELAKNRESIVRTLMWEIGKNRKDAESEFDRTVQFAHAAIDKIKSDQEYIGEWQSIGSTKAFVRRAAIGVYMALAPYNYPLNECYAAIIPALLLGNIVIVKIPTVGGLAHLLTMEAFQRVLPENTMNFIAGSGRATMPPLMATGNIDGLAFIGGSSAADNLIKSHPHPHRLKVFLQLEANNMAIYLPDIFESGNELALENGAKEGVLGSLSYNGQRCTALKLHFVPAKHADEFVEVFVKNVEELPVGLPYQKHGEEDTYSKITPLPNQKRVQYMKSLIADALEKGAKIMNKDGGKIIGGDDSTLMVPAVLYPVTSEMNVYHEEQFGPVVPITVYSDLNEILEFGLTGQEFGQQVSVFTADDSESLATILDKFSAVFGKVNINSQCARSPDVLPFSGRRSSAMGVMSIGDALREFSVPTVVAYKDNSMGIVNQKLAHDTQKKSNFLQPVA